MVEVCFSTTTTFCETKMAQRFRGTALRFIPASTTWYVGFMSLYMCQVTAEHEHLGSITINNEPWLVRTISVASGTRVAPFRDAVRERDRGCVITGEVALNAD